MYRYGEPLVPNRSLPPLRRPLHPRALSRRNLPQGLPAPLAQLRRRHPLASSNIAVTAASNASSPPAVSTAGPS